MGLTPRNLYILLVDDDQDVINVTSLMLQELGHVVRGETGSLNALRVFSEAPEDFDLAILDVSMAQLTGLELAQRFKRIQRGFPVILYGGNIDQVTIHGAEEGGISWFKKPATMSKLETIIGEVLGGYTAP